MQIKISREFTISYFEATLFEININSEAINIINDPSIIILFIPCLSAISENDTTNNVSTITNIMINNVASKYEIVNSLEISGTASNIIVASNAAVNPGTEVNKTFFIHFLIPLPVSIINNLLSQGV